MTINHVQYTRSWTLPWPSRDMIWTLRYLTWRGGRKSASIIVTNSTLQASHHGYHGILLWSVHLSSFCKGHSCRRFKLLMPEELICNWYVGFCTPWCRSFSSSLWILGSVTNHLNFPHNKRFRYLHPRKLTWIHKMHQNASKKWVGKG